MNPKLSLSDINRRLENLIRIGVITDVDLDRALCRVQTGNNKTDWRPWLTTRAGQSKTWWAPSVDEQVLIFSIGGNLETSFILPSIYSNQFDEPSSSTNANVTVYPDGARFEYEPENSTLKITGVQHVIVESNDVTVNASSKITLNTPLVECKNEIQAKTFNMTGGGKMAGRVEHTGGDFISNGVVIDKHIHDGVETGGGNTGKPK